MLPTKICKSHYNKFKRIWIYRGIFRRPRHLKFHNPKAQDILIFFQPDEGVENAGL